MDRQLARARVPRAMELDFAKLADGIKRNNVGTAAITVLAEAEVKESKVVLRPTGQAFALEGKSPADATARRRKLQVHGWEDPAGTRLEIVE
jgi:hypothetical protein